MRAGRASHTHGGYPRGLEGQNAREFSSGYTRQGSRGSARAGASRFTFRTNDAPAMIRTAAAVPSGSRCWLACPVVVRREPRHRAPMYHLIRSQVDRTEIAAWRTHTAAAEVSSAVELFDRPYYRSPLVLVLVCWSPEAFSLSAPNAADARKC